MALWLLWFVWATREVGSVKKDVGGPSPLTMAAVPFAVRGRLLALALAAAAASSVAFSPRRRAWVVPAAALIFL